MPWNDAEQSCLRKAACSGGFFPTAGTREDWAVTNFQLRLLIFLLARYREMLIEKGEEHGTVNELLEMALDTYEI